MVLRVIGAGSPSCLDDQILVTSLIANQILEPRLAEEMHVGVHQAVNCILSVRVDDLRVSRDGELRSPHYRGNAAPFNPDRVSLDRLIRHAIDERRPRNEQ